MTTTPVISILLSFTIGLLALIWHNRRSASARTVGFPPAPTADSSRFVSSILSFSAYLLESNDEHSVLRASMRAGCELLDAEGSLFIPFDEFMQKLPALEFGRTPDFSSFDYDNRLTNPSVRQMCKVCEVRQGGPDCELLQQEESAEYFNYCVPLRQNGREAGLFSFIFRASPQVNRENRRLLDESLRLAELALDAYRMRAQVAASMTGEPREGGMIPPEVEARAILGERVRVAREIHDGLAQTLAFLKLEIDRAKRLIEQGDSTRAVRVLSNSSNTLSDAFLDARQAIEDLRSFEPGDLEACLRQAGEDFEALSGLKVDLHLFNLPPVPVNVQAQALRIIQEALTNVRKHANASLVKISAWGDEGFLQMELQDNGPGFATMNPIAKARFGLRGMRERAEIIGADFQVESRPGHGVTIRLRVPLPGEAA